MKTGIPGQRNERLILFEKRRMVPLSALPFVPPCGLLVSRKDKRWRCAFSSRIPFVFSETDRLLNKNCVFCVTSCLNICALANLLLSRLGGRERKVERKGNGEEELIAISSSLQAARRLCLHTHPRNQDRTVYSTWRRRSSRQWWPRSTTSRTASASSSPFSSD